MWMLVLVTCSAQTEVHQQSDGVVKHVVGHHVTILQQLNQPLHHVSLNHLILLLSPAHATKQAGHCMTAWGMQRNSIRRCLKHEQHYTQSAVWRMWQKHNEMECYCMWCRLTVSLIACNSLRQVYYVWSGYKTETQGLNQPDTRCLSVCLCVSDILCLCAWHTLFACLCVSSTHFVCVCVWCFDTFSWWSSHFIQLHKNWD